MLTQETIEKMNAMKLFGMVASFDSQLSSNEYHELSFEERVGLLVDSEWTDRERRKLSRRLKVAKLRYPASLENVNFQAPRGLNRQQILTLGSGRWIAERHNLLITGPTGIGKSFLACAFVERACRRGFASYYVRASRLVHDLAVARGDGSYTRVVGRLAKFVTFLPSTIGSCTRSTMPRDVTSWKSSRSAPSAARHSSRRSFPSSNGTLPSVTPTTPTHSATAFSTGRIASP